MRNCVCQCIYLSVCMSFRPWTRYILSHQILAGKILAVEIREMCLSMYVCVSLLSNKKYFLKILKYSKEKQYYIVSILAPILIHHYTKADNKIPPKNKIKKRQLVEKAILVILRSIGFPPLFICHSRVGVL